MVSRTDAGPDAFNAELVAVMPRLRRFCLALAGSPEGGDDLTQAVLERALTRREQFRLGTRLEFWLFRMARNLQIDMYRAAKSRGGQAASLDEAIQVMGSDGRQVVELRSDLSRAGQAFLALPKEQREVLALVVLEGLAYRDVADMLDLPLGTVTSRVARARAALECAVREGPAGAGGADEL